MKRVRLGVLPLSHGRFMGTNIFSSTGNWLGLAPIPTDRTLEKLETRLKDSTGFITFLRRVLTWIPEERPSARELLDDPWLTD